MFRIILILLIFYNYAIPGELKCDINAEIRSFKSWTRMYYRNKISEKDYKCIKKYFKNKNYDRNTMLLNIRGVKND